MLFALDEVTVSYANFRHVLDHVSISINENEFIGITGVSGSGKTTLLETLSGLHKPASGTILFRGEDIYRKGFDSVSFRRKLQTVFQFPENLFFETDVRNETAFGPKMLKYPETEVALRVDQALLMTGLSDKNIMEKSPFTLSGGQKRRLALACALAISPEVLLLDEPFSGLDAEGYAKLSASLNHLRKEGMTILMVSHDPDLLYELADRVIVISEGRIVMNGTPLSVYGDKERCRKYGIARPGIIETAETVGLPAKKCNNYANFITNLSTMIMENRS